MNQVINQEVDRQVNQLIDEQMNQVIWQDELVMWIKDFTVAFSEGAYSVPFEHSMARRAIIEQGATPLEVAECWDEIIHAVNCAFDIEDDDPEADWSHTEILRCPLE
tara:strand:- start:295 stop:615 length:321 start_codon:yes stop_codon:yes gene_type:complete